MFAKKTSGIVNLRNHYLCPVVLDDHYNELASISNDIYSHAGNLFTIVILYI